MAVIRGQGGGFPLASSWKRLGCISSLPARLKVQTNSRKAETRKSFLSLFLIHSSNCFLFFAHPQEDYLLVTVAWEGNILADISFLPCPPAPPPPVKSRTPESWFSGLEFNSSCLGTPCRDPIWLNYLFREEEPALEVVLINLMSKQRSRSKSCEIIQKSSNLI